jgi:hypothetical protein
MDSIRKQLIAAIWASGQSLNQLGKAARLDSARLSRFTRGQRDLTLEGVERLCQVLGLHLAPITPDGTKTAASKREKKK